MKKILTIILVILPFSAFSINQEEASAISSIIQCKNIIDKKKKINCFEDNIENLENIFPIATLDEKERMVEITKIEKEKNEETFGVLQNINPEIKNSNRSLEFIKSVITDNDWVNYGKLLIELENGQVWKQVDSSPYRGPKDLKGKPIIINSASLGSFLLKIDGVGGKYRVRREK